MSAQPPFEDRDAGAGMLAKLAAALARTIGAESDRLFLWGPVLFGAGIAIYFGLRSEPTPLAAGAIVAALVTSFLLARPWPLPGLVAAGLLCVGLGFANAKLRTVRVAAPALAEATGVVAVRGWIERIERRQPSGFRITLAVRAIEGLAAHQRPERVRITSTFKTAPPASGAAVIVKAVLRPVPEPVQPHGFDFARTAWFDRLGAVGYAVAPARIDTTASSMAPEAASAPPMVVRLEAVVDYWRDGIEARIADALPGVPGALATALITGERGGIPKDVIEALRNSGLAHILAISGLHMALMAGALYWLVRMVLAAFPAIALRYPIKKWAACVALAGGAFYLVLSGAAVATQRAFIMMAILFLAILAERPALTLRNVALAAWIILVAVPDSLFEVGFQMSFAAVVGLVAVYEETARRRDAWRPRALAAQLAVNAMRYMAGIGLTTLVASIAIAPYAAYHFHKLAQYGLIANMLAMPLVGLLIMPMALVALLTMPFGLEALPLMAMAHGLERLVAVAKMVAGWDGAVIHVAAMTTLSLALLTAGGLWLCLWRTRWRAAGIVIAALGLLAAPGGPRPDLLLDRDGKLHAVRDSSGSLATVGARSRYSLEQWLLADGDARDPAEVASANAYRCDALACLATVRGKTIAFIRHPAALKEECAKADVIVTPMPFRGPCPKARVIVDRIDVWAKGAHAIYLDGQSIRVETVAEARGERPWVQLRRRRGRTPAAGTALAGEEDEENRDEP